MIGRKVNTLRRLGPGGIWLLVCAWVWLLVAEIGLRRVTFNRLRGWMVPAVPENDLVPLAMAAARIARTARVVSLAARHHLVPMTCLRQALVLQRLLSRQGVATRLQIGVKPHGPAFAAHAWLEHADQVIGQPVELARTFSPLATHDNRSERVPHQPSSTDADTP